MPRYSFGQVHPAVRRMILACPKAVEMLDEYQQAHLERCKELKMSNQPGVYMNVSEGPKKQYVLISQLNIKVVLSVIDTMTTLSFRTHDDRFFLVNNTMRLGFKLPDTLASALGGKLIGEVIEGLPPGFEKTFIKSVTQSDNHTVLHLGARLVTVPRERHRQKAILAAS